MTSQFHLVFNKQILPHFHRLACQRSPSQLSGMGAHSESFNEMESEGNALAFITQR